MEPTFSVPLITFVLSVRAISTVSGPHCNVILLLSNEHTIPVNLTVSPNATLPNTHPATTVHIKIFTFMPPLNPQRLHYCKLLLRLVRED